MHGATTTGIHHLGLTVSKLEETASFFTSLLGWQEVRRKEDYPAVFVSDGTNLLTLWAIKEDPAVEFNKNKHVGLHHVAFTVESEAMLNDLHKRLTAKGVRMEFVPELLGPGPAKHMMCYEPRGTRIEFVWPGT